MSDETDPLALSPEAMRALGYRVVDLLVDHHTHASERPIGGRAGRAELEARLREPVPAAGRDPLAVLDRFERDVRPFVMPLNHPRFFGFVPGPAAFVGAMGDTLAAGINVFCGAWLESSGAAQLELVTLDWIRTACGLPEGAAGVFTSGGSAANLAALAAARRVRLGDDVAGAVVYASDQTHASIDRGLRLLGFAPGQLRRLPSDAGFRMDPAVLRRAVAEDRAAGRRPFCVIANPGTTNTGAVDPLPALADLCHDEGLWLHADGAYGAAAVFCPRGRALLRGLDRVDSLSMDPHKWLFQPYEIGCVLVRDGRHLRDTFYMRPEYMEDVEGGEAEVNFCDYGLQLTRSFRALKLWMTFQVYGAEAIAGAQERGFRLAETAARLVAERADWTVVTPPGMAVAAFRCAPDGWTEAGADALNAALVDALIEDGLAMVSSTRLRGRTVLRMCTINPRTTEADLAATIDRLDALRRTLQAERVGAGGGA